MTYGPDPQRLHGTEARARRHRRAGEKPCQACREAEATATAYRKLSRPARRCGQVEQEHLIREMVHVLAMAMGVGR